MPNVLFDAVGPSAAGAAAAASASLTWSHTVGAGANRLLVVDVAVGASGDTGITLGVTFNGVPMTSVAKVHSNNSNQGYVERFQLVAPATGTFNVVVTVTGGTPDLEGGSVSCSDVNQTTPLQNIVTAFGSSATPSIAVTSAVGNMVIDAVVNGGAIASSLQTSRWIQNQNGLTAGGNGASSTADGAASVTMSYAVAADWWAIIGADIVAAAGGGAPADVLADLSHSPQWQSVIAQ